MAAWCWRRGCWTPTLIRGLPVSPASSPISTTRAGAPRDGPAGRTTATPCSSSLLADGSPINSLVAERGNDRMAHGCTTDQGRRRERDRCKTYHGDPDLDRARAQRDIGILGSEVGGCRAAQ